MLARIIRRPVFDDEEKTRIAGLIDRMVLAAVLFSAGLGLYYTLSQPSSPKLPAIWAEVGIGLLTVAIAAILVRLGWVRAAALWFVTVLWLQFAYQAYAYGGISSPAFPRLILIPVFLGLLLGGRAALIGAVLTILFGLALVYASPAGLLPDYDLTAYFPMDVWATRTADLFLVAVLLVLANRGIRDAVERARQGESIALQAKHDLEAGQAMLQARTRELERRSAQLQAAAEVGQAVTSTLDPEQLVWRVAESVQQRFDLYHVGLFEIDPTGRWADYRAGAGEGSRALAARRFRLDVGGPSLVGWSTANAQPRVVNDVLTETLRVDVPEVSLTRSEAALPLLVRGRPVGALSVQSDRTGSFDADTVQVLQNIADQVAVALDNAWLFRRVQDSLAFEQRAYGEISREDWVRLLASGGTPGYRYLAAAPGRVVPIGDVSHPEMEAALQQGQTIIAGPAAVAMPIQVRGQTIGVIDLHKQDPGSAWTSEEVALVETLSAQLAAALDSARLYQETQGRAARERLIGEVTARVRETLDIDEVLQTAIRQVGDALGLAEVEVRIGTGPGAPGFPGPLPGIGSPLDGGNGHGEDVQPGEGGGSDNG